MGGELDRRCHRVGASGQERLGAAHGRTVVAQVEEFLADPSAQIPTASRQLIKKALANLKRSGKVRLVGRGRSARWRTNE
jgi:hypothetical protein